MPGFWISRVTQGLTIILNMTGFWIAVRMQLRKGSEYSGIPNMLGFCICAGYTSYKICLNTADQYVNKLFWLWHSSQNAWSKFHSIWNMTLVLDMPGVAIWQSCEYVRVIKYSEYTLRSLNILKNALRMLNMSEYTWINRVLNMAEFWIFLMHCIS